MTRDTSKLPIELNFVTSSEPKVELRAKLRTSQRTFCALHRPERSEFPTMETRGSTTASAYLNSIRVTEVHTFYSSSHGSVAEIVNVWQ